MRENIARAGDVAMAEPVRRSVSEAHVSKRNHKRHRDTESRTRRAAACGGPASAEWPEHKRLIDLSLAFQPFFGRGCVWPAKPASERRVGACSVRSDLRASVPLW